MKQNNTDIDEPDRTVFAIIKNTYGAYGLPESVWADRQDAINRARELADGAEFDEKESDGWAMEGHAVTGCTGYEIYEYHIESDTDHS